ncbi:OmpA family protein [Novosphingobium sp. HBC54]|uniref:OmpA family protein n=2 Tax=Novosphingobium cyanobacteriorum TaxID=3024215 RepID=A0ABT6CG49_9SPHN|nr:OmpA family protein [Novosphingobium cyanobacteriorum]
MGRLAQAAALAVALVMAGTGNAVAQAPAVRIENGLLVLPQVVRFAEKGDTLAGESEAALAAVVRFLAEKPSITLLRVETNTAAFADPQANIGLGRARAERLAAWFRDHGVDCGRLIFVTFGSDKPAGPQGSPMNDRVDFAPARLRNIAIGGMPVDGNGVTVQAPCG